MMKKPALAVLHFLDKAVPGLRVARTYKRRWLWVDAPLFYANADYFLSQVQELIDEAHPAIDWLLIDAEAIVDIDVTAVEALSKLQSELERKGVIMAIARASQPLKEILKRAGLTERIGSAHFYPTVRTGVRAFIEQQEELTGGTS